MLIAIPPRSWRGALLMSLICGAALPQLHADGTHHGENYCVAVPNSTGAAAVQSVFGPDHGGSGLLFLDDTVLLGAYPVPRNAVGLFLFSPGQTQLPFGDGNLCLSAPIHRLPALSATFSGLLTQNLTFSDQPGFAPGPWNFQAWFRDANGGPAGFNLSNGLALVLSP